MKDLVKAGYNQIAEMYSAKRDQFKNNKYLDFLVRLLPSGATILDLGCGSGLPIAKYFDERSFKVIGLDISEKQIELARANVPRATFEVKDISELIAGQYRVDAVVSFYTLSHLPKEDHESLIRRINSFLSVGGLMLITMGASDWEGTEENFHGVKMWWSHFGPEKNRKMVEDAGFEIIVDEIDSSGGENHQVILARKR
ncbi:MAG: class I SAM-dependent methyltransferase [bacterium]|nr:class I SAM-dependent methyltransferase [bacterium]